MDSSCLSMLLNYDSVLGMIEIEIGRKGIMRQ